MKTRVAEGGHNINPEVIERRYYAGIYNLFNIYLDIADQVFVFDNTEGKHIFIAEKLANQPLTILDTQRFSDLKKYYDNRR